MICPVSVPKTPPKPARLGLPLESPLKLSLKKPGGGVDQEVGEEGWGLGGEGSKVEGGSWGSQRRGLLILIFESLNNEIKNI